MSDQSSQSFPRRLRLTHATGYHQVFKKNIRYGDSGITILVGKEPTENPRLGFAVARKQIPKAVQRNALKRMFRESFRRNQNRLPARDMVIMVRREILLTERVQLQARLDQHWDSIIKQCKNC